MRVDRVGRHDNFFELGGHSLLGMKLIGKVAEVFTVSLSVISVFKHPTLMDISEIVESLYIPDSTSLNGGALEFEEGVIRASSSAPIAQA